MYKFILGIIVLALCKSQAQQYISFTYDAAGNRIKRELVLGTFRKSQTDSLAVADELGKSKFQVFPNPTQSVINIVMNDKENIEEKDYALISISGNVINKFSSKDNRIQFDLSTQPAGVYLLKISNSTENVVWRVVKE
ncbi:MAG: T9SS type A sorting domain-containing protein [Cytophagales bacterium]